MDGQQHMIAKELQWSGNLAAKIAVVNIDSTNGNGARSNGGLYIFELLPVGPREPSHNKQEIVMLAFSQRINLLSSIKEERGRNGYSTFPTLH